MNSKRNTGLKKLLCCLLLLPMIFTHQNTVILANELNGIMQTKLTDEQTYPQEMPLEGSDLSFEISNDISPAFARGHHITQSENRIKYESLINGNYSNTELASRFRELYGYEYSDEAVRTNYRQLFDLEEGEQIDEAFLNSITNYVEDFSIQAGPSKRSLRNDENNGLEAKLPEAKEPAPRDEPEETIFDSRMAIENVQVTTPSALSIAPMSAAATGNSFANITFVSKTSTSVTVDIWFKSGDDINNYLKMYDTNSWSTYWDRERQLRRQADIPQLV